mmetsp:Transcript_4230/g.15837  ORF Transcript_4230/g.15837 Transcript_4230/m.15837 type:complete len:269 (+) Transcript_4230:1612-2418(+)
MQQVVGESRHLGLVVRADVCLGSHVGFLHGRRLRLCRRGFRHRQGQDLNGSQLLLLLLLQLPLLPLLLLLEPPVLMLLTPMPLLLLSHASELQLLRAPLLILLVLFLGLVLLQLLPQHLLLLVLLQSRSHRGQLARTLLSLLCPLNLQLRLQPAHSIQECRSSSNIRRRPARSLHGHRCLRRVRSARSCSFTERTQGIIDELPLERGCLLLQSGRLLLSCRLQSALGIVGMLLNRAGQLEALFALRYDHLLGCGESLGLLLEMSLGIP